MTCRHKVEIDIVDGMTLENVKELCNCNYCCGELNSEHWEHIENIINSIKVPGKIKIVHDKDGSIKSIASTLFKGQED
jgi:hypothetical protein